MLPGQPEAYRPHLPWVQSFSPEAVRGYVGGSPVAGGKTYRFQSAAYGGIKRTSSAMMYRMDWPKGLSSTS